MLYLQDQINLIFVGSLGDTHQLAAVGLGNMVMMLLPYSIMIGVNTALETFVAQAFGSNNLKQCGLYLHRAILLIVILYIPITIVLFQTGHALTAVGFDETVADHADSYVKAAIFAVFMHAIADSMILFMAGMG